MTKVNDAIIEEEIYLERVENESEWGDLLHDANVDEEVEWTCVKNLSLQGNDIENENGKRVYNYGKDSKGIQASDSNVDFEVSLESLYRQSYAHDYRPMKFKRFYGDVDIGES